MNTTMIYFDVDGTLLSNDTHAIPTSTIQALQQLQKKGYTLGIATGRSVASLQKTGVMDTIPWDSYICNNGQTIMNQNQEILTTVFIPSDIVKQSIAIAKTLSIPLALKTEHRILTQEPTAKVYEACQYFHTQVPPVGNYHNQNIEAMIAYGPKGYDYAPFTKITSLHCMPGESTYCDITLQGVSKASAIQKELQRLHKQSYIAFGDSLNDVAMFMSAKTSIAMGQGNAYIKEIASFITQPIMEDGIYYACKKLQYIDD